MPPSRHRTICTGHFNVAERFARSGWCRPPRRAARLVILATIGLVAAGCNPSPTNGATPPHRSAGGSRGISPTAPATLSARTASWRLPAASSRQAVCSNSSGLVLLGGLVTGDTSTSMVRNIDPATGAVIATGRLPSAVHDAAGVCLAGRAIVFGGGGASTVATVQAWTPGGAGRVVGSLPAPRSDLSSTVIGDTAYVLGGFNGTSMQADILATTDGAGFQVVGRLRVEIRYAAVAAGDGYVWAVGGQTGTSESSSVGGQSDAIQRFDPRTGVTTVIGHLPRALGHASAAFLAGTLWVVGGEAGTVPSTQMWAIDPATGKVRAAGNLPAPRSDAGTAVVGTTAYLLGGENSSGPAAPLDTVVALKVVR